MSTSNSGEVVLVDESDNDIGVMDKVSAHVAPGFLHRAISACLYDPDGRILLQRRALEKYHFGGRWSNACCTHPGQSESPHDAVRRRIREELGVESPALTPCGTFIYRAEDPESGLVEWELDHVFAGILTLEPVPDPSEVAEYRWVRSSDVPDLSIPEFTPWLGQVLTIAGSEWSSVRARFG